jgi:PAS domain S-box-containing protein
VGEGTTFTVWIPLGRRPPLEDGTTPPDHDGTPVAAAMAEEILRWDTGRPPAEVLEPDGPPLRPMAPEARVLVVDDNRDLREYLTNLLGAHWTVAVARDGDDALASARRDPPDLVLADVMMPGLDGFALLQQIRDDPRLAATPVILLTARAGEEAAIEGLLAGADDYVVKPFGARELVTRVGAQLELARMRRRTAERDAFLLRLNDALRSLADPQDVMEAAARLLAEHLGVERVAYGEVTPDGAALVVERDHAAAGAASVVGTYRFADFPIPVAELASGTTFVADDVAADERFSAEGRAVFAAIGSRATCSVPLVKRGRFVANLNLHHPEPRTWTADDVRLVEDVAERTWAAVERARAEARLHRFATFVETSPELIAMSDLDLTPLYLNAAGRRLLGLDDLHGVSVLDFFCDEDRARLADDFFGRVGRDGRAEVEVRFRHLRGEPLPVACSAVLLTDADGRESGYAVTALRRPDRG